eukprot:29577_1
MGNETSKKLTFRYTFKMNDKIDHGATECCKHLKKIEQLKLEKEYWKNKYEKLANTYNQQITDHEPESKVHHSESPDQYLSRLTRILKNYNGNIANESMYHDTLSILSDFLHLFDKYNDDHQFEMITNTLGQCNASTCSILKRHYRNRTKNAFFAKQNESQRVICQVLDKIHCFYYHCYDIGYKLYAKDQDAVEENSESKIIKLKQILSKQQQSFQNSNISDINIRKNTRYTQLDK